MNEHRPSSADARPEDENKRKRPIITEVSPHTDPNLYTVEGKAHQGVSGRTLKKRLARLASSRAVLILAALLSLSAVLTAFRGYLLPVTVFLTASRAVCAAGLWTLYFTAGKKGGRLLAAYSLWSSIAAVVGFLLIAAFIVCAMFGKLLLIRTDSTVSLARDVLSAKTFAVVPALICVMAAYCTYLFKRYERQLFCNVRDGLRYGFPFEQGCTKYAAGCVYMSVLLAAVLAARAFVTSFSRFSFLPSYAVGALDRLLIPHGRYALLLAGLLVQIAVYALSAGVALRYGGAVKKFKAQKAASDSAKRSAEESASAVLEAEKEKAVSRAERAENSVKSERKQN